MKPLLFKDFLCFMHILFYSISFVCLCLLNQMAKSIKELRKENGFLKNKSEKSDVTLIELANEVSHAYTLYIHLNLLLKMCPCINNHYSFFNVHKCYWQLCDLTFIPFLNLLILSLYKGTHIFAFLYKCPVVSTCL